MSHVLDDQPISTNSPAPRMLLMNVISSKKEMLAIIVCRFGFSTANPIFFCGSASLKTIRLTFIGGMIVTDLGREFQIGAEESGTQIGNEFLVRIASIAPSCARIQIKARKGMRRVSEV